MEEKKYRSAAGVFAILCLAAGAVLIVTNFRIDAWMMLGDEFSPPQNWTAGLLGIGLISVGVSVIAWLRKDRFIKRWDSNNHLAKKTNYTIKARRDANFKGHFLLGLLGMILLAILYYLYFG